MSVTVGVQVEQCDKCPFAEVSKVYTADSWDNVRKIHCKKLGIEVFGYLDWYDKSPVPDACPFKEGDK